MNLKDIKNWGNFKGVEEIIMPHEEGDVYSGINREDDEFLIVLTYHGKGELFESGKKVGYKLNFESPLLLSEKYGKEFLIRKSLDDYRPLVVYVFKMRKSDYN